MAYAEAGRFDEALTTARQALDLATASGQKALAAALESELRLYHQRRPYHSENN